MWVSSKYPNLAVSPDAVVDNGKKIATEALECKSLEGVKHFEAWYNITDKEKRIPYKYRPQITQYFVVNDKLKKMYMAFYNPEFKNYPDIEFFYIEITRREMKKDIENSLQAQTKQIEHLDKIINKITF